MSVVICAYADDRWRDLLAAVASVQAQSLPAREIIVVVDHNDALLERVRRQIPGVVAVANGEARGLSGARNSGVAVARGEIIAFLDDDAAAAPDWLRRLRAAYDDPRVLGVGGAVEPAWVGGRPAWFPDEFDWVVGCTYRGMPRRAAAVRNLIGANMSFRRGVFDAIGGFRSGIGRIGARPVGCEETELCIRGQQRWPDGVWRFEPRARVVHTVQARRGRWGYFRARCYAEGRSKALVARMVGAGDGLASERSYTLRTLSAGISRGLAAALRRRDAAGLARAGAIAAGFAITTFGYLTGAASAAVAGGQAHNAGVAGPAHDAIRPWRAPAPEGG
jgi:glycosyltransferase involved in cell wall biosynthesis